MTRESTPAATPTDSDASPKQEPARAILIEALVMWTIAFIAVLILAIAALGVNLIAANLYALVAAVFIGLPYWLLRRKSLDPDDFGLSTRRLWRNVALGLGMTLLTLPPFIAGQHLWETQVQDHKLVLSADNYAHWPIELEGQPQTWGQHAGAWLWSNRGALYLGMRATKTHQNKLIIEAHTPFIPLQQGSVLARRLDDKGAPIQGPLKADTRWELIPKVHHRPVTVIIQPLFAQQHAPKTLKIKASPAHQGAKPWTIYQGQGQLPLEANALELGRGYLWILLWILTQLFFIALPEEYFYRGYLQTRLKQALGERYNERWMGKPMTAIVLTSLLFGLGHLLVPVAGSLWLSRMSVFFPSLLFGWLRERTGTIVTPMVYHAGCNLMVLFVGTHYY